MALKNRSMRDFRLPGEPKQSMPTRGSVVGAWALPKGESAREARPERALRRCRDVAPRGGYRKDTRSDRISCATVYSPMVTTLLAALLVESAQPAVPPDFGDCLRELRDEAKARGVSAATFDRALKGVTPDPSVLEAMQTQPEFETPVWDYLARLVDDKRIAEGQARLAAWG